MLTSHGASIYVPDSRGLASCHLPNGSPELPVTLTDLLTERILLSYTPEMGAYDDLKQCTGFDWDHGNEGKNWEKHRVSDGEAEEIFFNDPLIAETDEAHSKKERRYFALSQTNAGRPLFVVFMIRKNLIRIISAREMTNRELRRYTS